MLVMLHQYHHPQFSALSFNLFAFETARKDFIHD